MNHELLYIYHNYPEQGGIVKLIPLIEMFSFSISLGDLFFMEVCVTLLFKVVDSTERCWELTFVLRLGKMIGYIGNFTLPGYPIKIPIAISAYLAGHPSSFHHVW